MKQPKKANDITGTIMVIVGLFITATQIQYLIGKPIPSNLFPELEDYYKLHKGFMVAGIIMGLIGILIANIHLLKSNKK
jgi:hypothetical protein